MVFFFIIVASLFIVGSFFYRGFAYLDNIDIEDKC